MSYEKVIYTFIKKSKSALLIAVSALFFINFSLPDNHSDRAKEEHFIFFDLGDVILKTSTFTAFMKNKGAIAKYMLKHGIPDSKYLKNKLYLLIDHCTNGRARGTATNSNQQVPGIMCDWLEGKIDSEDFVDTITNIDPNDDFFESKAEGELLVGIARLMLPEEMVAIHKTTKTLNTLRKCCEETPGRVGILSNWDKDSIDLLKERFPEIFEDIDDEHIIFSGECGYKKPDHDIYEYAAAQVGVNPGQCVLVDDQEDNIDAAYNCGWSGIHHTSDKETAEALESRYGITCNA